MAETIRKIHEWTLPSPDDAFECRCIAGKHPFDISKIIIGRHMLVPGSPVETGGCQRASVTIELGHIHIKGVSSKR